MHPQGDRVRTCSRRFHGQNGQGARLEIQAFLTALAEFLSFKQKTLVLMHQNIELLGLRCLVTFGFLEKRCGREIGVWL